MTFRGRSTRTFRGRSTNCLDSRCGKRGALWAARVWLGNARQGVARWFVRTGSSGRFCRLNLFEEPSRLGVCPGRVHSTSGELAKNRTELQNHVKIRPVFLRNRPELYPCCISVVAVAVAVAIAVAEAGGRISDSWHYVPEVCGHRSRSKCPRRRHRRRGRGRADIGHIVLRPQSVARSVWGVCLFGWRRAALVQWDRHLPGHPDERIFL